MAGVPRSLEIWNAREQLTSADLMRAQVLASRDAQDQEAARSRSFDSDSPNPGGPADLLQFAGTPISGIDQAPTLTGASGFSVNVGAGSGFLYNTGFAGLTTDDSPYLVVRWAAGQVTHPNPDGANPRIDIIFATPATASADQQSRTVLVDPTTRSITAQSVYKTSNPTATLSVLAGAPAANPTVPAIAAGALPLFYVYVPAAAGSAGSFAQCRASWRRVSQPWSSASGVACGMGLRWDLAADPSTTTSAISIPVGLHRVLIDGELMEFAGGFSSSGGTSVVVDSGNNPFTAAAPGAWSKPYYIYAVGGRHNPMPSLSGGVFSPVTIVESLVPPNISTRKPVGNMTVNGQTVTPAGAVYIGLGFVSPNTTRRAGCIMDDDFTYTGAGTVAGANAVSATRTGATFDFLSSPPGPAMIQFPTSAKVQANVQAGSNFASLIQIYADKGDGSGPSPQFSAGIALAQLHAQTATTGVSDWQQLEVPWPDVGGGSFWMKGGATGDLVSMFVLGYKHRVRMFGLTAAP
jgi:hypothetical protein